MNDFFQSLTQAMRGDKPEAGVSRRDLLRGVGLFGAVAVAGPALFAGSEAQAEEVIEAVSEGDEAEVTSAQYRSRSRRRRRRGRRGRRYGRRRRYQRPRQRFSWRQARRRCANDWRFRRRNPGLCRRVLGMRRPRRGACFHFGPVTICG